MAISVIGDQLVHRTASATEIPLPPLSSSIQEGSTVYADDGTTVLAVLRDAALRKPVNLDQVSAIMKTAVLDTEDHRFYLHGGFDIYSTVRAATADSSGSNGLQGGSTIAQQLVKQVYLTSARKLSRKIKEAVIADRLEQQYTKDQILQAYLNTIYLGDGAYGVEAAAETYFGEHASQLDIAQSALLAGLIQAPSGYNPVLDPVAARNRRSQVLARMLHYGDITLAQEEAANATPLPNPKDNVEAPTAETKDPIIGYYVQQVETELLGSDSPLGGSYDERYATVFEGGLKIYTNLDPSMQTDAEQAIDTEEPNTGGVFQEAMVAIDPTTGKVRALVGGTGYTKSPFDIITEGHRQPGSGFKLFTLLAALEQGYSIYDTVDGEGPCEIAFPGNPPSKVQNDSPEGKIDLVTATADSVNCAYIRLAHEVGLPNVIAMAHNMGISESLPDYPSIVLGSIPVEPIEMASAYATIADNGVYHAPSFIDHIVDRTGDVIYRAPDPGRQAVPQWVAAEATVALRAVVQYGTGTAASIYDRPVAGKTGTTNKDIDAWFNGFTPQLEATVWMGNEQDEVPMQYGSYGLHIAVYGATYPAPTWHAFAVAALAGQPVLDFVPLDYALLPETKYIDSKSLEQDDVLGHNQVAPPTTTTTTIPGSPPTTIVTATTVPVSPTTATPSTTTSKG